MSQLSNDENIQIKLPQNSYNEIMQEGELHSHHHSHQHETGNQKDFGFNDRMHHCEHHHQHDHQHEHIHNFHDPHHNKKTISLIWKNIKKSIKKYDDSIVHFYKNLTGVFNFIFRRPNIPNIIKRIFYAEQIIFFLYISINHYLLIKIQKKFFFILMTITFCLMMLMIIILIIFTAYCDNMYVEKDDAIEKKILQKNPNLNLIRCNVCKYINYLRVFHCIVCNKCVKKFQLHSDWFNICIGCSNELLYYLTITFIIIYLITCFVSFTYVVFTEDILNSVEFIVHIWIIISIYITIKTVVFYIKLTKLIFTNLTFFETESWHDLPYLFGEGNGVFFNPFNKGIKQNFKELWLNTCYKKPKVDLLNGNIPIPTEEEEPTIKNPPVFNPFDPTAEYKHIIELSQPFSPYTSPLGNVLRKIEKDELINWSITRAYQVFQIANSPFVNFLIQHAKQGIEQQKKFANLKNKNK